MKKNTRRTILAVYIILCLGFIWGQSVIPIEGSAKESGFILEQLVHPLETRLFGKAVITDHQIRKTAHVFEYMMLSLGFSLFFRQQAEERKGKTVAWMFSALSAGLFAAFIDETIQLFSGRGSQVSDIWVDGIGVALGILIVWLIGCIRRKKQNV